MKLIRDDIPGMPDDAWDEVCPVEAYDYLKLKLTEEIDELIESDYKDKDEYADVIQVLKTLARYNNLEWSRIEVARKIKLKKKNKT